MGGGQFFGFFFVFFFDRRPHLPLMSSSILRCDAFLFFFLIYRCLFFFFYFYPFRVWGLYGAVPIVAVAVLFW